MLPISSPLPIFLVRRAVVAIITMALLTGCAGQCGSILSVSSSPGCETALVGGAILLAPVFLPVAAVDQLAGNLSEKKDYLALKEGVEKGDLAALEACVASCGNYLVFKDEKFALRRQAVQKLLALDSPDLSLARVPAMMTAYSLVAWRKESTGQLVLDREKVFRGWELASRYRSREHSYPVNRNLLADMAENVFVARLQALPDADVTLAFETCVTDDLLPAHPELVNRDLLCAWSYKTYHRKRDASAGRIEPSNSLQERWSQDDNARIIAAHEAEWLARDFLHRQMASGVEAGERTALEWCIMNCPDLAHRDSRAFTWNQRTLRLAAARKLIALDTHGHPAPHQRTAMAYAYMNAFWSWRAGAQLALNSAHIERAWELASGPPADEAKRTELAPYIFAAQVDALPQEQIADAFENCVTDDLLPAHHSMVARPILCSRAYSYYREMHPGHLHYVPPAWESRWQRDWKEAVGRANAKQP